MTVVNYTVANGRIIGENRNGVKRDYVADPLGSTRALLDSTQTLTDTFDYWPYGEVKTRTGTTPTPFQFVGTLGYYQDSSKTYVRARHLDTQKGRWLTQDPIGFNGGDYNLYRYVRNRPVVRVDPMGEKDSFFCQLCINICAGSGLSNCRQRCQDLGLCPRQKSGGSGSGGTGGGQGGGGGSKGGGGDGGSGGQGGGGTGGPGGNPCTGNTVWKSIMCPGGSSSGCYPPEYITCCTNGSPYIGPAPCPSGGAGGGSPPPNPPQKPAP